MSRPTKDDLALWEAVKKTVSPLKKHKAKPDRAPFQSSVPSSKLKRNDEPPGNKLTENDSAAQIIPHSPQKLKLSASYSKSNRALIPGAGVNNPSMQPLDKKEKRGVTKGKLSIDARIDLHGMTQERAKSALRLFITDSHRKRLKIVLIITGKGGNKGVRAFGPDLNAPGVLKRVVPHWLRSAEFSAMVIGFEPAARHHGGDGALYVRLKRKNSEI